MSVLPLRPIPEPLAPDMTGSAPDMTGPVATDARCAFFCKRLRPVETGGEGVAGSGESGPPEYLPPLAGSIDCGRFARRMARDCGREDCGGGGREFAEGFLGSGSGAHDSTGRWSEGSTSRPSCVIIFPVDSS